LRAGLFGDCVTRDKLDAGSTVLATHAATYTEPKLTPRIKEQIMLIPLIKMPARSLLLHAVGFAMAGVLSACGGGGNDGSTAPTPPAPPLDTYDVFPLSLGGTGVSSFVKSDGITTGSLVAGFTNTPAGAGPGYDHGFLYDGNKMVDLGTLGGTESHSNSINSSAQIVGWTRLANDAYRAFLYDGTMHDLGTLGGPASTAYAINEHGQITGWSDVAGGGTHAFLYDHGVMKNLGTLGGQFSYAVAINAAGQVTGHSNTAQGADHGFISGACACMRDIGTLGGDYAVPEAINDAGQVVGTSLTAELKHRAFLYDGTSMKDLGTLGGDASFAKAINRAGLVIGVALTSGGDQHAFVYDGTSMKDLGTFGGTASEALAINGLNQVVGSANTAGGQHAMSWTAAGGLVDLNTRIPNAPAGTELLSALAVSDEGSIVARAKTGLVLLKLHRAN
jgi:probable HAF family extracellular repeat protein